TTTDLLLRAGADIQVLNAVRQRLSRIKGGGLARAAAPAQVVNLIISDVLGNPLPVIASGPTIAPQTARPPEASGPARGHGEDVPAAVRDRLRAAGPVSTSNAAVVGTWILADAATAARAAAEAARRLGYHPAVVGTTFDGEARDHARLWVALTKHARKGGRP